MKLKKERRYSSTRAFWVGGGLRASILGLRSSDLVLSDNIRMQNAHMRRKETTTTTQNAKRSNTEQEARTVEHSPHAKPDFSDAKKPESRIKNAHILILSLASQDRSSVRPPPCHAMRHHAPVSMCMCSLALAALVLAMAPYGSELIAHIIAILARTEGPWRGLLVMVCSLAHCSSLQQLAHTRILLYGILNH